MHDPAPAAGSERLQAALPLLPHGLLLLDADLRLVAHNGVAHAWLGLAPDRELGSAVHPDDRAVLRAAEAEFRTSQPGWQPPVPVRVQHADGHWHLWSMTADNRLDDPSVGGVVVLVRDITGQSASPAGYPDALLRELVNRAPVAAVTLDPRGRIRFAAGEGLAFEAVDMIGRPLSDFVDSDEHRSMIARAVRGEPLHELTPWGGGWWDIRYSPLWHDGVLTGTVGVFSDVTDRALAEQALTASEAHLRGVLAAVREPLVVVDADWCITTSNEAFSRLFGPKATAGNELAEAVGPGAADLIGRLLRPEPGGPARCELRLTSATGAPVWVLVSGNRVQTEDGRDVGAVVVLTDITSQKDAERRLMAVARTDPVTGVLNRSTLADRLDQALARRSGTVGVLFCDVDGLKAVNDRHGHVAGDVLLRAVATRIASALRPSDGLVRYGGDEFVAVCDELPDPDEARQLAERVSASVAQPLRLAGGGPEVVPTVSVGVATSPPRRTAAELLAAADVAVYAAKAAGRSRVRVDG